MDRVVKVLIAIDKAHTVPKRTQTSRTVDLVSVN